MTKRELIDEIVATNHSAEPEFLAQFADNDLSAYLQHLQELREPKLVGDPGRYDRYFRNCPTIPGPLTQRRPVSQVYMPVPAEDIWDEPEPAETLDEEPAEAIQDQTVEALELEPVETWAKPLPIEVAENTQQPQDEELEAVCLELDEGEYVSDVAEPTKPAPPEPLRDEATPQVEASVAAARPVSEADSASEFEPPASEDSTETETWLF
jgi:hypothetical protein